MTFSIFNPTELELSLQLSYLKTSDTQGSTLDAGSITADFQESYLEKSQEFANESLVESDDGDTDESFTSPMKSEVVREESRAMDPVPEEGQQQQQSHQISATFVKSYVSLISSSGTYKQSPVSPSRIEERLFSLDGIFKNKTFLQSDEGPVSSDIASPSAKVQLFKSDQDARDQKHRAPSEKSHRVPNMALYNLQPSMNIGLSVNDAGQNLPLLRAIQHLNELKRSNDGQPVGSGSWAKYNYSSHRDRNLLHPVMPVPQVAYRIQGPANGKFYLPEIGVVLERSAIGEFIISGVVAGGPASLQGVLKSGDIICAIERQMLQVFFTMMDIRDMINSIPGYLVQIVFARNVFTPYGIIRKHFHTFAQRQVTYRLEFA
ncbi:hypothetical protein GUITHDRAFT_113356 [Guillardia theta CCMP2712]|uniref:PDZ domain-containing protein n=1 Tax=Guillardia theta (strain CCMP2712) TaxID=905079 RepID=L1IXJ1_GUITC|nr:hypothetical protein GUITHDRAFT_113356 [Guillardia theta CCMP2712]EKX40570.1 hypothetical protein GUITHDRAFT_113356 [Guillardia theta CCMP2712]|eukprot:XP_005827550.1 hypothetical protein GUITHDRAFT_113356 [Guillardia theta CCMP2712]